MKAHCRHHKQRLDRDIARAIEKGRLAVLRVMLPAWQVHFKSYRDGLRHANQILKSRHACRLDMLKLVWDHSKISMSAAPQTLQAFRLRNLLVSAIRNDAIECVDWLHEQGIEVPPVRSDRLPEGVSAGGRTSDGIQYPEPSSGLHKRAVARSSYERVVFNSLCRGVWPSLERIDPFDLLNGTLQPEEHMAFGYSSGRPMSMVMLSLLKAYYDYPARRNSLMSVVSHLAKHPLIMARQAHVCGEAHNMLSAVAVCNPALSESLTSPVMQPLWVHMFRVGVLTPTFRLPYLPAHIELSFWWELEADTANLMREAYTLALSMDLQSNTPVIISTTHSKALRL